jgi:thioredoxin-dependent peroxiredoxin
MAMIYSFLILGFIFPINSKAADLKVGDNAPLFTAKTHEGKSFELASRKGQWTVLYFYPKAETPGCTTQACAFRDSIKKVRDLGAEVYGISSDDVTSLAKFHEHHHLNFPLLSDSSLEIIKAYGTKMPLLKMSKRWTFIVDPELKIRVIDNSVDPAKDVDHVADTISKLQKK